MRSVWGTTQKTKMISAALAALTAGLMLAATPAGAATGLPGRTADPVVLKGSQTPLLAGIDPDKVVAFTYDGGWRQIAVQVDERKVADFGLIRQIDRPFLHEAYADPNTWTGADGVGQRPVGDPEGDPVPGTTGDPMVDANDEIALLSRDAGTSATGVASPAGVVDASRTTVTVGDPLGSGGNRFLYLFEKSGGLSPAAGSDYVDYDMIFSPPLAGGYLSGYDFGALPGADGSGTAPGSPVNNPEASFVSTDVYEQTFPGRWMINGLKIHAGDATGVDILDGDKASVGQNGCGRNELTFSRGGGGVIAAIDGPVRAIRSYIGANSGTFTQRDQIYYPGRMDNNTYLRVHQGITDFIMAMDYSEAAFGMTYRNSVNENPVTIDGTGGAEGRNGLSGNPTWELVTGDQGSLTNVLRLDTNIPGLSASTYYQDEMNPPDDNDAILCSGDDHAIGASGPRIKTAGSNTDPTLGKAYNFTGHRTTYYSAPGETVNTAKLRSDQVDTPLTVTATPTTKPSGPTGPTGPDPKPPAKPGRKNWVGLKVKVKPAKLSAHPGSVKKVKVTVQNIGDQLGRRIKICPKAKNSMVKTSSCQIVKKLKPERRVKRTFRVRLRSAAAGKDRVVVRFRAKATKSNARTAKLTIRPR